MAIKFSAIKFSVLTLQGQRMNFSVSPNPDSAGPVVNLKLKTLVFRSYWTKTAVLYCFIKGFQYN